MWSKLWRWVKVNYWGALGFLFCIVAPIYLLNEVAVLAKTSTGVKLTFMGCIATVILFIIFYKQLKRAVYTVHNLIARESLLTAIRGIWWAVGIGIIYSIVRLADKLEGYWQKVGICFLIGSACYLMLAMKRERKRKLDGIKKENELTERIAVKIKGEV